MVNFAEHTALLAANVAHALGLPGSPPAAVAAARDKVMTRALAAAAGLPQPRCRRIRDSCDLAAAARHVGFPAVLKPTSGSGSQGVVRVDDEAQLALRYGEACAALRRAVVVSGALQPCAEPVAAEREPTVPAGVHDAGGGDGDEGGCEGGGGRPWACSAPPPFLLEELLVGPEARPRAAA